MKVKELFELWLEKYIKPTVKIRTYNKYESVAKGYIIPLIGEVKLMECNCAVVQDYVCKLLGMNCIKSNTPLATNTIYGIVQVLKQGFKLALELELIIKDPTLKVKLPPATEKKVLALTREEKKY